MLKTKSYYTSYEGMEGAEVDHKYYFGELSDGSAAANDSIHELDENGIGAIGEIYDEDGNEYLVSFKVVELRETRDYLDSVVQVVSVTEL